MKALSNDNEIQFHIERSKTNKQVFSLFDPKNGGMICDFRMETSLTSRKWSICRRGVPFCLIEERSFKEKMDTWSLKDMLRTEWRLNYQGERIAVIHCYGLMKSPSWTMKELKLRVDLDSRIPIASLLLLAGLYD